MICYASNTMAAVVKPGSALPLRIRLMAEFPGRNIRGACAGEQLCGGLLAAANIAHSFMSCLHSDNP